MEPPPAPTERIDCRCLFQACLIVWGSDGQRKEVGCAVPSSGMKSKHFLTGTYEQMGQGRAFTHRIWFLNSPTASNSCPYPHKGKVTSTGDPVRSGALEDKT